MTQITSSLPTLESCDNYNTKEENNFIHSDECEMEIVISEVHGNAIDEYFGHNEDSEDPMLKEEDTYNIFKENFESMSMEEIHLTNPEYSYQFNLKPMTINQVPFDVSNEVVQNFYNSPHEETYCSRLVENGQEDIHYDDIEIVDEFAKITEGSFYPNESEREISK